MLPTIQGVRLTEQNGSIRVSGRNLVPIEVEPEEVAQLEAVHLGGTQDQLALAVKDLGDAGYTVLQMKTARDGAPVDRMALYRFATGTKRNGRMAVRPPHKREPIDIRSQETVKALCFFEASGRDYGLANAPLARGLKALDGNSFRFHPDGVDNLKTSPFRTYSSLVEWGQKRLWVSQEGGPRVPFTPEQAERPEELRERYALARTLELPENLSARETAELWETGYTGQDPEIRLRCLARLTSVVPLKSAVEHYASITANFEATDRDRATETFVELARASNPGFAAESMPLIAVPVEAETLQERAALFAEIAAGPAGSPGATPVDRRVDYVRGAIQRFAENDPAGARARLSNIFVLERNHHPAPGPAQAMGTSEGRLVIGGVLVRGKK